MAVHERRVGLVRSQRSKVSLIQRAVRRDDSDGERVDLLSRKSGRKVVIEGLRRVTYGRVGQRWRGVDEQVGKEWPACWKLGRWIVLPEPTRDIREDGECDGREGDEHRCWLVVGQVSDI